MHFRYLSVGFAIPDVAIDIKGVADLHMKGYYELGSSHSDTGRILSAIR